MIPWTTDSTHWIWNNRTRTKKGFHANRRKFDSQSGDAALRAAEVACLHPVTGKKITVKSMSFLFLSLKRGDPADVLFDPLNDKIRMVDLLDP